MSLVKLDFCDYNEYLIILTAPSLPSGSRCLIVSNDASGARWYGSQEPPSIFFSILGVKIVALEDGYFALASTDEGITKYLSVDVNNGGRISATASHITEKEKFSIFIESENVRENRVYLSSATGKFVTMVESVDELSDDTIYEAAANSEVINSKSTFSIYALVRPDDGSIMQFL